MKRKINFSAGPATLPQEILEQAQAELLNWDNSGVSILEAGHRTKQVMQLIKSVEIKLREVINIPDDYHVLFLPAPARSQFAMLPQNFLGDHEAGGYLVSGLWSKLAFEECKKLKKAQLVNEIVPNFLSLPEISNKDFSHLKYLYYTPNETVDGIQFPKLPDNNFSLPLIADMTSFFLMEPIDFNKYSMIFSGAQKNLSNASLTIVIIKDAFLKTIPKNNTVPSFMDYNIQIAQDSLFATPPVFNIYLAGKMLSWIETQGGVTGLFEKNKQKAKYLYDYLDNSSFYNCEIDIKSRSYINVCFKLINSELTELCFEYLESKQFYGIRGHRQKGGLRISMYNAIPLSAVKELVSQLEQFAEKFSC